MKSHGATKKELSSLPSHYHNTKFDDKFIRTYYGLCLKMGTKADDNHYVILVDVDNKNGTVDEWLDLLTHHQTTTNFKTPTAITGNDGISVDLYKQL